ncbi:MAG TPA: dicarboxylate/amino acid:cation symporter [Polyangia bacterium]
MNPRRMLVGMFIGLALGLAANLLAPGAAWVAWTAENVATPIGQVFLRLLFMLVVPLVFSALVIGICGLELGQLGRLGLRTLGYATVVSAIAALIGLVLVNVVQPGNRPGLAALQLPSVTGGIAPTIAPGGNKTSPIDLLVAMVPDNPIKAAANGDMIGFMVFALFFGVAVVVTRTPGSARLIEVIQGLYDVMMTCIRGVLKTAPLGVGALLFVLGVRLGTGFLGPLLAYVGVVLTGLLIHMLVVYSLLVKVIGKTSPVAFFRGVRVAMLTAFSTASSNATLPTALQVAEQELKLPPSIARFVLTVGSTMNQNGTALYEGVTVLFLAQIGGVDLPLPQQALVMAICVLAGVGTAGIPGGSLPVIAMILGLLGVPPEGLGLILGVDRFLDMCRTTLNVTGDLAVAVAIAGGSRTEPTGAPPPIAVPG